MVLRNSFEKKLQNYVRLLVRAGVNVRPGQGVVIYIAAELYEMARLLVKEAYEAGAAWVRVEYSDEILTGYHYEYREVENLAVLTKWELEKMAYDSDQLPAVIHITSEDPDGLRQIDQEKMALVRKLTYPQIKPFRDKKENRYQWLIAGAASAPWAKKIFPALCTEEAVARLWEAIFVTSRVNAEDDALLTWEEHNNSFKARCEWLNSCQFSKLHYRAGNGTDLTVELIPDVIWEGGGETLHETGVFFQPNIPTEEIFTTPRKGGAEGIVYASKPLSYQGQLIEDFWIRFAEGKACSWGARKGEALLGRMLTMDENAGYLGECALVPFSSPINQSGILFWNTLFDENASCHLAVGRGFSNLLKNFQDYSNEEIIAKGINDSMIHVDFMIGTDDMAIDGETQDGRIIAIFRNGEWV